MLSTVQRDHAAITVEKAPSPVIIRGMLARQVCSAFMVVAAVRIPWS